MVISVSRRCDIPRFAFDWFLERLNEGFVDVKNPFNANQVKRVSLLPASAGAPQAGGGAEVFAFWTRDPAYILDNTEALEKRGCAFYVMTTLTGYPAILEPNAPPPEAVIQTLQKLAKRITPDKVIWRYDPVFLSNITNFEFHRLNFSKIAARLSGSVKRVIVSLYDEYSRAEKRLAVLEQKSLLERIDLGGTGSRDFNQGGSRELLTELRELLADMAGIALREGMEIQSCAEELSDCGIVSGACIDAEYLGRLFYPKFTGKTALEKDPGQRSGCRCVQSIDIGSYGRCSSGCVYCYAS